MGIISPITAMASEPKSRHLLVAQGSGDCTFLKCSLEKEWDMIQTKQPANPYSNNPATSADSLVLGLNMFVVGFASGTVKLFLCDNGAELCEIAAHSR